MSGKKRLTDSQRARRGLLIILIAAMLLLYALGAAALWARHKYLSPGSQHPGLPVLSLEWTQPNAN
jgi:hypothetical protein